MAKLHLTKNWNVSLACDFYYAGLDESGILYVSEAYYLIAEDVYGNRYVNNHYFLGCEIGNTDNGSTYFTDVRDIAKKECKKLLAKVNERGYIDFEHWVCVEPAYGSVAYCRYHNF